LDITKGRHHISIFRHLRVKHHLSVSVIGERLTHVLCNSGQLVGEACSILTALAGLGFGSLPNISNLLVRCTRVPTALALASLLNKAPSQCSENCDFM